MTRDLSTPHAWAAMRVIPALLGLAVVALRAARGGQPVFGAVLRT